MSRGVWRRSAWGAMIAPLLVFVACSGGSGDDDSSGPPPSATPEQVESVRLEVEPVTLLFGDVVVGDVADMTVTVTNGGVGTLSTEAVIAGDSTAFSVVDGDSLAVAAGESATVTVRFAPSEEAGFAASLEISSNDESQPTVSVALAGTGVLEFLDQDQDGWTSDIDCDDDDPGVYPGAAEVCDEVDNDCDGMVDEDAGSVYYQDQDQDGFGVTEDQIIACYPPIGYADQPGDCDDANSDVSPAAEEVCNDLDDNCDGEVDEGVTNTYYLDADEDGFGDYDLEATACYAPPGYVPNGEDCDDTRSDVNPDAPEVCDGVDNDCDTEVDENLMVPLYPDQDLDGHGAVDQASTLGCESSEGWSLSADDCDDTDASVYTGALEACDGVDNDCDGAVDEEGDTTFYADADGDGHGDPAISIMGCNVSEGFVSSSDDCDDNDASIYPGAVETCNGRDDDCDGQTDEDVMETWYVDADQDGFGNPNVTTQACEAPDGFTDNDTDCDDSDAAANPDGVEVCDGLDNNCDGQVDEDVRTTFYLDADGDGFGDASTEVSACAPPTAAYVSTAGDCDDLDPNAYPGGTELCNGHDDDCDGTVDEPDAADAPTWYQDTDGDGHGNEAVTQVQCDPSAGFVAAPDDCDDTDPDVHPGADEVCNGVDDDCDGTVDDEPIDPETFYRDVDGDGYGVATDTQEACTVPEGYAAVADDCDDGDAAVYPGATEYCNDTDDDCNGAIDDIPDCVDTLEQNQVVNAYTWVTAYAAAGATQVNVDDTSVFSSGDRILVVQVQGSSAGRFELADVQSVEPGVLVLAEPLVNAYGGGPYDQFGAEASQVVRVATYNNLVIDGAEITCPAWDGYAGGIVAIEARYDINLVNGGTIVADGGGFRGPARELMHASNGRVGEGILGNSGTRCSDEGTEPDTLTGGCGGIEGTYDSNDGLGGAGGGANASDPPDDAYSYNSRYPAKSGHAYAVGDPNTMIMGGGGGQGDSGSNDWYVLAKGGDGGGMIFLWARNVSGGTIHANGSDGEQGCDYAGYGGDWGVSGGGGGAGGSILIDADTVSDVTLSATGGAGGNVCGHESYHSASGGAGRIVIEADDISVTTDPPYIH